jgi:hypothetical protein
MEVAKMYSPEGSKKTLIDIEKQFIQMRSSGSSIREIARTLKKSTRTICEWNKKFEKDILYSRNSEFCELQKKIIDLKTSRVDFLKTEIERISSVLRKRKIADCSHINDYDDALDRFIKLTELMTSCENDMFRVGINFRDNVKPESNIIENEFQENNDAPENEVSSENTVSKEKYTVSNKLSGVNTDKTNAKKG